MSLDSVTPVSTASTNSHINQQDFLRILLTQLNAQDPLKPMDNGAFVAQLAQFSQLEQAQESVAALNKLASLQSTSQTLALMGKTVDVIKGGSFTSGTITAVSVSGSAPSLTVHPASGPDVSSVERKDIYNIR
ncbi:MAG: flagellar hook assembly protein FlgD [Telluria sp.]